MKGAVFVLAVLCAIETASCLTDAEIVGVSNALVTSVYVQVVKRSTAEDNRNILVSPFSLLTALMMMIFPANGDTYQQIQEKLRLHQTFEQAKSVPFQIFASLRRQDVHGGYQLAIASKFYGKNGFVPNEHYQSDVLPAFECPLQLLNFTENMQSAATMDQWVQQETRNKIRNLIDPSTLGANIALMLLNGIHFKADFAKPFASRDSTFEKPFYNYGREKVSVPMMTTDVISVYNYFEATDMDAKFLELKFYGNEASLVIVLPFRKDGLAKIDENLGNFIEKELTFSMEYVRVSLPKFKIEADFDLKDILLDMGLGSQFDKTADLTFIGGAKGETAYNFVQKAFINVNEEGVEAAAATAVSLSPQIAEIRSAPVDGFHPKTFNVDHPFVYYIKVKGVVTFIGRIVNL